LSLYTISIIHDFYSDGLALKSISIVTQYAATAIRQWHSYNAWSNWNAL